MRKRPQPLRIPEAASNWFTVDVPGRDLHAFRIPRATVLESLRGLLVETDVGLSLAAVKEQLAARDTETYLRVRLNEEAVGACIGEMWRHPRQELDTDRRAYPATVAGALAFGGAVMEELEDAGYLPSQIAAIMEAITPRMISALLPGAREVAARAAEFHDASGGH